MPSAIKAISYYLPDEKITDTDLAILHPDWPVEKITKKIGIKSRHSAGEDQYSLELGIAAAKNLFREHTVSKEQIDFIIFCTQTPKFLIPTSACLLQEALGLKQNIGAIDINQGCSGYVYALMLAHGLIVSKVANHILLITADTYTKLVPSDERCLVPIFGDAATASLISSENEKGIVLFEYGTDGEGAEKLMASLSGVKGLMSGESYKPDLYMNGAAIFNFTLKKIPQVIDALLKKSNLLLEDVDLFIFHQANAYILEHLREKITIRKDKFYICMAEVGNTVSSSIPIALAEANREGLLKPESKIVLVGFGVGLSWAACLINW